MCVLISYAVLFMARVSVHLCWPAVLATILPPAGAFALSRRQQCRERNAAYCKHASITSCNGKLASTTLQEACTTYDTSVLYVSASFLLHPTLPALLVHSCANAAVAAANAAANVLLGTTCNRTGEAVTSTLRQV